jgi:hypothetical protein
MKALEQAESGGTQIELQAMPPSLVFRLRDNSVAELQSERVAGILHNGFNLLHLMCLYPELQESATVLQAFHWVSQTAKVRTLDQKNYQDQTPFELAVALKDVSMIAVIIRMEERVRRVRACFNLLFKVLVEHVDEWELELDSDQQALLASTVIDACLKGDVNLSETGGGLRCRFLHFLAEGTSQIKRDLCQQLKTQITNFSKEDVVRALNQSAAGGGIDSTPITIGVSQLNVDFISLLYQLDESWISRSEQCWIAKRVAINVIKKACHQWGLGSLESVFSLLMRDTAFLFIDLKLNGRSGEAVVREIEREVQDEFLSLSLDGMRSHWIEQLAFLVYSACYYSDLVRGRSQQIKKSGSFSCRYTDFSPAFGLFRCVHSNYTIMPYLVYFEVARIAQSKRAQAFCGNDAVNLPLLSEVVYQHDDPALFKLYFVQLLKQLKDLPDQFPQMVPPFNAFLRTFILSLSIQGDHRVKPNRTSFLFYWALHVFCGDSKTECVHFVKDYVTSLKVGGDRSFLKTGAQLILSRRVLVAYRFVLLDRLFERWDNLFHCASQQLDFWKDLTCFIQSQEQAALLARRYDADSNVMRNKNTSF